MGTPQCQINLRNRKAAEELAVRFSSNLGGDPETKAAGIAAHIINDFAAEILVLLMKAEKNSTPPPEPNLVGTTYSQAEFDEAYEFGKRDGYEEAVQDIDQKTGGDGEYRYCLGMEDDIRHQPDPATMIQRIVDRFEVLNLLEDATRTGRDQPGDGQSTPKDQKLPGGTITLTPAEAWSLLYNDPKDVRAQTITRMAVWLDGLRFNPATAPEGPTDER